MQSNQCKQGWAAKWLQCVARVGHPAPPYLCALSFFPTSLPQKCSSENCSTLAFCFLPLVESSQWAAQRGDRRDGKAGGDAFTSFPPCLIQDASGSAGQPLLKDSRFSEALQHHTSLSCPFKPMCAYAFLLQRPRWLLWTWSYLCK